MCNLIINFLTKIGKFPTTFSTMNTITKCWISYIKYILIESMRIMKTTHVRLQVHGIQLKLARSLVLERQCDLTKITSLQWIQFCSNLFRSLAPTNRSQQSHFISYYVNIRKTRNYYLSSSCINPMHINILSDDVCLC